MKSKCKTNLDSFEKNHQYFISYSVIQFFIFTDIHWTSSDLNRGPGYVCDKKQALRINFCTSGISVTRIFVRLQKAISPLQPSSVWSASSAKQHQHQPAHHSRTVSIIKNGLCLRYWDAKNNPSRKQIKWQWKEYSC